MRVVKAASVQLSPVLYSREGTIEKVVRKIHQLGQRGVQFATFPETVVEQLRIFTSNNRLVGGLNEREVWIVESLKKYPPIEQSLQLEERAL